MSPELTYNLMCVPHTIQNKEIGTAHELHNSDLSMDPNHHLSKQTQICVPHVETRLSPQESETSSINHRSLKRPTCCRAHTPFTDDRDYSHYKVA